MRPIDPGLPHPWPFLTGTRPNTTARWSFITQVISAQAPTPWVRWACEAYLERWSDDELVLAVRTAHQLGPIPLWTRRLLRQALAS